MATQCRESKKKPKRNFARLYTAFLVIALLGGLIGYAIGAVYTPQKTVTVTETISSTRQSVISFTRNTLTNTKNFMEVKSNGFHSYYL